MHYERPEYGKYLEMSNVYLPYGSESFKLQRNSDLSGSGTGSLHGIGL